MADFWRYLPDTRKNNMLAPWKIQLDRHSLYRSPIYAEVAHHIKRAWSVAEVTLLNIKKYGDFQKSQQPCQLLELELIAVNFKLHQYCFMQSADKRYMNKKGKANTYKYISETDNYTPNMSFDALIHLLHKSYTFACGIFFLNQEKQAFFLGLTDITC